MRNKRKVYSPYATEESESKRQKSDTSLRKEIYRRLDAVKRDRGKILRSQAMALQPTWARLEGSRSQRQYIDVAIDIYSAVGCMALQVEF